MKRKILALGLLSLCSVALLTPAANGWGSAGGTGTFPMCNFFRHNNKFTTQITCRPYNAFTPICWGNLVCDGCCPSPCGVASGCMPMMMMPPPWAYPQAPMPMPMPYMGGGGYGPPPGAHATDMPMHAPPPTHLPPALPPHHMHMMVPPTPFTGPPSMPTNLPRASAQPLPTTGVAQVNYQPNYYPAANPDYSMMPNGYYPPSAWTYPQQQVPYYWYGYGR